MRGSGGRLGVVIGVAFKGVRPGLRAAAMMIPLAIAVGAAVSAIASEIEPSVGFLVFDTFQVAACALLTYLLARAINARRAGTAGSAQGPS